MRGPKLFLAITGMLLISLGSSSRGCAVDFASPVSYPVGTNPAGIVVADLNGDGKPDIAVANSGSGNVSILLGNGDGTFQAPVNFDAGMNGPTSLAVNDFNRDAKMDLAVFQAGDPQGNIPGVVSVLLGNGDGTFQAGMKTALTSNAVAMVIADFNLDKMSDIAIRNYDLSANTESLNIYLAKGNGTFNPPVQTSIPSAGPLGNAAFAAADISGDAKPDLVLSGPHDFTVFFGNGDGTFQQGPSIDVANVDLGKGPLGTTLSLIFFVKDLRIADADNDGAEDVIVLAEGFLQSCLSGICSVGADDAGEKISIFLGSGGGSFQSEQTIAVAAESIDSNGQVHSDNIRGLLAGDFNGDGKFDIVDQRCASSCTLEVRLGAGDGTFAAAQVLPDAGALHWAQDLNGDFLADLVVTGNSAQNDIQVLLNTSPAVPRFDLTVAKAGTGSGTVTSRPVGIDCGELCSQSYASGTAISLTAVPSAGSHFDSWSGACTGTDPNSCVVTLNSDQFVTATFTIPPDFSVAATSSTLTVKRGGQVSEVLNLPAQGGFSATIALTCSVSSGPAPMPQCGVSPASVTPDKTATLTVSAASLSASGVVPLFEHGARLYATWLPLGLLGCVAVNAFDKKRRRLWALFFLLIVVAILPAACGGGSVTTPPPQNYTVTVTAISGAIQHSTAISVTVQ